MLGDILKKTALKWGIIGGFLSPALLLSLLFFFPNNSPYQVYSVGSILAYSLVMILAIRTYKRTFVGVRFALKDGFLAGALTTFLAVILGASIIYLFFTWQDSLFEQLKEAMIPDFSIFESQNQGQEEYETFIKDIKALNTTSLIRTEITKRLPILFFVDILSAAYFRTT